MLVVVDTLALPGAGREGSGVTSGGTTIRYLSTLRFSDAWLDALRRAAPALDVRQITATDADEIPPEVWDEVEILHTGSVLPDPDGTPRLRWVQLDTAGVDHLHDQPIWRSDVDLTTIGGVSPVPMAEYVVMMVLAFGHHLPALGDGQRRHEWPTPAQRWERYLPRPVADTTIGIVGFGRIGREIGRLAEALGMRVVGGGRPAAGACAARRRVRAETLHRPAPGPSWWPSTRSSRCCHAATGWSSPSR
jgi:phosphoglycerate dehydrogenase-like enzyme